MKSVARLKEQFVAQRKSDAEPYDGSTPLAGELRTLWEESNSGGARDAAAACAALVSLVQRGHLDFNYAMQTFLNNVPTAKTLIGTCRALTDLLVLQLCSVAESAEPGETVRFPYSIRSPPHPFISLLSHRSDCWPLLQQQVRRLLAWKHNTVEQHVSCVLEPLIRFLLLEPQQSAQFSHMRAQLPRSLLQGWGRPDLSERRAVRAQMLHLLLDLTPRLQVNSGSKLGEATCFLETMAQHVWSDPGCLEPDDASAAGRLARHLLTLSRLLQADGLDPSQVLTFFAQSAASTPQVVQDEGNVAVLAELLFTCDHSVPAVLQIGRCAVGGKEAINPFLAAMLILPALRAASVPHLSAKLASPEAPPNCETLAAQLIAAVEEVVEGRQLQVGEPPPLSRVLDSLTAHDGAGHVFARLCDDFVQEAGSARDWLRGVHAALCAGAAPPRLVSCLVVSVLVVSRDLDTVRAALKTLPLIAKLAEDQAASLLPVVMYKLSHCDDPQLKLELLNTVPELAIAKVCVAPVLRTLQALATARPLRAVALRLMTTLWRLQDRVFPHLHAALLDAEPAVARGQLDELMVAQAASVRDICVLRGQQYGEDVLPLLSDIINASTAEAQGPVAALALQGLHALCESEVIDIKTTWTVLAPTLDQEKRPLVVHRICELFSLVPEVESESDEYQDFMVDVAERLWRKTQDPPVCSAAYSALAAFSPEHFKLDMLPPPMTEQAHEAGFATALEEDEATPTPPGTCYTDLLPLVPHHAHSGYQAFLTSLLTREVQNLPRGLHHASARGRRGAAPGGSDGRVVERVAEFLRTQYEKNKQPVLRQGLAVGLLLTFDPPAETGRDGKPGRQALAARGRVFHQMLYTLLHEISVVESDWHRRMFLPEAWTIFMQRCFTANMQSRAAELELKLQRGQVDDLEEHQLHVHTAWLWTRDKLLDLIKSISKGGPSAQANCVCAAVGLAVAVHAYASALDHEQQLAAREASEYSGHAYWMSILTNTLLAILEPGRPPAGRIFPLCQQSRGGDRAASAAARGAVAASVARLVRLLATSNSDALLSVLASLQRRVPGRSDGAGGAEHSESLGFYNGLGLGTFLGRLFEERFAEVTGAEGMVSVWKALDVLEDAALSEEPNRLGSLLGLGAAVSALCGDARPEARTRLTPTLHRIKERLFTDDVTHTSYAGLCMCAAVVAVRAFSVRLMGQEDVDRVVAHIYQTHLNLPHDTGVHLALGCVCHGLARAGHPTVGELAAKLGESWLAALQDQEVVGEQRVACASGLFALAGSETPSSEDDMGSGTTPVSATAVVEAAQRVMTAAHCDLRAHTTCAWLLARLHAALEGNSAGGETVPTNYGYLPDSSVLKPVVARLQRIVKDGSGGGEGAEAALLLCSVRAAARDRLPPLNWAPLLSSLTRQHPDLETTCLEVGALQGAWAPSAALYVTTQLQPQHFDSLTTATKVSVYHYLPTLIKVIAPTKLDAFFETGLLLPFTQRDEALAVSALRGLHEALRVKDPPQHVTASLYRAVSAVYELTPSGVGTEVLEALCGCLRELPDQLLDQLTQDVHVPDVKTVFVRCHLVGDGSQPLAWLNPVLEAAFSQHHRDEAPLLLLLSRCFLRVSRCSAVSPLRLQHWLLELMGLLKALATQTTGETEPRDLPGVLDLATQVFAVAVISWSGVRADLVLGLGEDDAQLVDGTSARAASPASASPAHPGVMARRERVNRHKLLTLLPCALDSLTSVEPWKQVTGRLLDWLLTMRTTAALDTSEDLKTVYTACLHSLRHTKEFSRLQVWSAAAAL